MKTIRCILVSAFVAASITAAAQYGSINQKGLFAFKNYRHFLKYLDYCDRHEIEGTVYIYFKINYPEKKSVDYVIVPVQTSGDTLLKVLKIKKYSCLKNGLLYDSTLAFLKPYILNSLSYEKINNISSAEFYNEFVNDESEVVNISDPEVRKAVIFILLEENLLVYEHDVSGSIALGRMLIKWR